MSLNKQSVNPLSALNLRKLNFIPEHFSTLFVDEHASIQNVDHWINFNLNSRYAIKQTIILDKNNHLSKGFAIGLEDPKEITMLILGCPFVQKKE